MNFKWNDWKVYNIFLHIIVIALAVTVVLLARDNRRLKGKGTQSPEVVLREGDYFTVSYLLPVVGNSSIDSASGNQLIFVFTTRCPFCRATIPFWNRLAASSKKGIQIIGISTDPVEASLEYAEKQGIIFPVFCPKDKDFFSKVNKLSSVPETILRSRDGIVRRIWRGELNDSSCAEVTNVISG